MSSSEDDFDEYLYQIVEFVKRGRPGTRSIDIVPMKWIQYDKMRGNIETKFKPPPYFTEDFNEIQKLVESNIEAPDNWPLYRVRVVARAKTYTDALKKLKTAEDKRYAFTTESNLEPEKKSASIQQKFKTKALQQNLDALKLSMNVNAIPVKNAGNFHNSTESSKPNPKTKDNDVGSGCKIKTNPERSKPKPKMKNKPISYSSSKESSSVDANRYANLLESEVSYKFDDYTLSDTPSSASTIMLDMEIPVISMSGCDRELFDESENFLDATIKNNNEVCKEKHAAKENNEGRKSRTAMKDSQYLLLMSTLEGMNVVIQQILKNQNEMKNLIQALQITNNGVGVMTGPDFAEKNSLELPFKTVEQFEAFDTLSKKDDCYKDFVVSLQFYIDTRKIHAKTINNIFKRYFSRELAVQFTAQKQLPGKIVLKGTIFCRCLVDLVSRNHRNENNLPLTKKEIFAAIGTSLSNAKDWDGYRSKRSKNP